MQRIVPISFRFVALSLLLGAGCGSDGTGPSEFAGPGAAGWEVSAPADRGMDAVTLEEARRYAFDPGKNTQGVVVVRNGVIVAEWYEEGRDPSSFASSWSVAKSFTGALIGIAIEDGLIEGLDVSMAEFLPSWRGTDKEAVRLRDVLSMASGLEWTENYSPAAGPSDIITMIVGELDHLAYVASRPLQVPPGTRFRYSSGDTMLLSGVLESVTGGAAAQYARERLFDPIGMAPVDWWSDASGQTATYCCIDTPSRDFARFGLLYLRGGRWDGVEVVPKDWVEESTSPNEVTTGYGYQWWLTGRSRDGLPQDVYSARGHDGQFIYVVPSLDLVVVRNGHYDKHPGPPVAAPSLWALLPSDGIIEGAGTVPPDSWNDEAFLAPILASVVD